MNKKLMIAVTLALILAFAFSTLALAQDGTTTEPPATFYMEVAHQVQGSELGLSKATPVIIGVARNGQPLAYVHMSYRDRVGVDLPAGEYQFTFTDADTGDLLFTCGPYDFGDYAQVRVQAHEKGPGRVPDCYVKEFD
ncbi:MAG: hypothetical protein ACK2UW_21550 [Anaerolineales bacterium]|jgi:hypothetical protein